MSEKFPPVFVLVKGHPYIGDAGEELDIGVVKNRLREREALAWAKGKRLFGGLLLGAVGFIGVGVVYALAGRGWWWPTLHIGCGVVALWYGVTQMIYYRRLRNGFTVDETIQVLWSKGTLSPRWPLSAAGEATQTGRTSS